MILAKISIFINLKYFQALQIPAYASGLFKEVINLDLVFVTTAKFESGWGSLCIVFVYLLYYCIC